MADYSQLTWVDDDGSGTVGTVVTAARMNNIEAGVKDAAEHNKSGTSAARPAAAAGNKGWLYFSTDLNGGTLSRSTGSAWVDVAPGLSQYQPIDSDLSAIGALTSAADKGLYATGAATWALYDLTSTARSLLDDTSTSAMRTTLGVAVGTDVQAYDAELAAIAGLASAADKGIYFTGSGTAAMFDLTSTARSLLDDSSTTAMLTTLNAPGLDLGNTFTTLQTIEGSGGGWLNFLTSGVQRGYVLQFGTHVEVAAVNNLRLLSSGSGDVVIKPGGGGKIDASSFRIASLADATAATDALNRQTGDARYLMLTLADAKGDMFVASGPDAIAKVAVGTDGYVWGADSTLTNGAGWKDSGAIVRAKEVFSAYRSSALSPASGTEIVFNSKHFDPSGVYSTSTGRFTPTRAGYYRLNATLLPAAVLTADQYYRCRIQRNGSVAVGDYMLGSNSMQRGSNSQVMSECTALFYFNGSTDYASVFVVTDAGAVAMEAAGSCIFQGEFVSADYAGSLTTPKFRAYRLTDGAATASLASAILFSTEDYDTNNNYDPATGKFTAPVAGKYHFDTTVLGSGTYATTTFTQVELWKNGAAYAAADYRPGTNNTSADSHQFSTDMMLAAGDTVEVRMYISTGNFTAFGSATPRSYFSGFLIRDDAAVPSSMEATTDFTIASGWIAVGGGFEEPRYWKDPFGIVHLEGYFQRNAGTTYTFNGAGATICTLPVGYRPEKTQDVRAGRFHDGTSDSAGVLRVDTNGTVTILTGGSRREDGNAPTASNGTVVSISGITFRPTGV